MSGAQVGSWQPPAATSRLLGGEGVISLLVGEACAVLTPSPPSSGSTVCSGIILSLDKYIRMVFVHLHTAKMTLLD